MKLYVVRHGETDWNVAKKWQGHADIPLNELGHAQARETAEALRGFPFTAIVSSPLSRASQTADAIAAMANLPVETELLLIERDVGVMSGRTVEQWRADHPGEPFPDAGMELWADVKARGIAALTACAKAHLGEDIVVVTHGGLVRAAAEALMPEDERPAEMHLTNASICLFDYTDGVLSVVYYNKTAGNLSAE